MAETPRVSERDIEIPSILLPCVVCNRTFRPEALAKHVKVCEKSGVKKRKVFDSSKQRIQGTDLAEFLPVLPIIKKPEKSPVRKTQSKWKEKHTELVRTIQAARVVPGGDAPTPVKPSDHEKCPHCERFFGPKAFDRHIDWCKEQHVRIQPKSPASLQAKERLEARTKYRAPLLGKSRRSLTKEKYSPHPKARDPSPASFKTTSSPNITVSPSNNARNTKEPANLSSSNFTRGTSFRNRLPSPNKKTSPSSKSTEKSNVSSNSATPTSGKNKGLDENKEDLFSGSCTITSIHPYENGSRPKLATSSRKNSASDANYDPFVSAERQMMELLGLSEEEQVKHIPKSALTKNPMVLSSSTSAFAKFSPIVTPGSSPLSDNNNEIILPPSSFEDLEAQCASPPLTNLSLCDSSLIKNKNRNPISLSSLSLCSSISIESVDLNRNGFRRGNSFSAKTPDQRKENVFQRSISLVDNPRKVRDLSKGRLKMEDLLYGSSHVDNDRYFGSPIPQDQFEDKFKINDNDHSSPISLHRSISDEETINAKQELLKSISDYENLFKSDSPIISTSLESLKLFPSLGCGKLQEELDSNDKETNYSRLEENKSGLDSAYNSLNRKSPLNESMNADPGTRSSSESENSAPSLQNSAARFCHECGNRYPVREAKFCCNCGVRRLVM